MGVGYQNRHQGKISCVNRGIGKLDRLLLPSLGLDTWFEISLGTHGKESKTLYPGLPWSLLQLPNLSCRAHGLYGMEGGHGGRV